MIQQVASVLSAAAVLTFAQSSQAQTNQGQTNQPSAANLLPVTFSAVCTSSNSTGLLQERVSNVNLIDDCAVEHGLTNLEHLRLVFNVTNFSLQVVDTNGVALCTSLAFTDGLTFTNRDTNSLSSSGSNSTQIVFQRNVTVETNSAPSGVISGSASWNNSDLSSLRLSATLLYTEPANGTNSAEICRGVLSARGARHGENEGGDHDTDHGEQDNHGHHFDSGNQKNRHGRH